MRLGALIHVGSTKRPASSQQSRRAIVKAMRPSKTDRASAVLLPEGVADAAATSKRASVLEQFGGCRLGWLGEHH
jgi:hypothetical protein